MTPRQEGRHDRHRDRRDRQPHEERRNRCGGQKRPGDSACQDDSLDELDEVRQHVCQQSLQHVDGQIGARAKYRERGYHVQ